MKLSPRYTELSLSLGHTCTNGRIFFNELGVTDLTSVEVVGASVDTVRQLYHGIPKTLMIDRLQAALDSKAEFFNVTTENETSFNPETYHLVRMGKVSRYRYKLQNNDLGIVILFGSFYSKLDNEGQHLKIELSPKFISARTPETIQDYLDHLSRIFLTEAKSKGCAVHLACDYQGHSLPTDFLDKLSTYSRTIRTFDGLCEIDLSDISEAVVTYGSSKQEKNYLIGKASSTQIAIYDKSLEIIKSDKVDYFHSEWGTYSLGVFDPKKVVRRIEARLHHQVVREIGNGLGLSFESFLDISKYLTDLWRYALKINRLNAQRGKDLLDPFWQILIEDVEFHVPAQNIAVSRKKKDSIDPISHNITQIVGNLISLCARERFNAKQVINQLKKLSCYPEIIRYYRTRQMTESDLLQDIEKRLALRLLTGKAA